MPNLIQVKPVNPTALALNFENGESFVLSYLDLRFACPCASCVDEITGQRTLKRESIKADIKPNRVDPVGRYGIQIEWSDGHRTGMYHFDRLYEIASGKTLEQQ